MIYLNSMTSNFTDDDEYVYFDGEKFIYSTGYDVDLDCHKSNFGIYEEPKKMIKVAPYLHQYGASKHYMQTLAYHKDDEAFIEVYPHISRFQRLTALEIEVEDYEQN